MRQHTRLVALMHDDTGDIARDEHVHPVDALDDSSAAADALAAHLHMAAVFVVKNDVDSVGMLKTVVIGKRSEGE